MQDYKLVCHTRKKYTSNKVRFPPLFDLNYKKPRKKKHNEETHSKNTNKEICQIVPIRRAKKTKEEDSFYPVIGGEMFQFPQIGSYKKKPVIRPFNLLGQHFEEPKIFSRDDIITISETQPLLSSKRMRPLKIKTRKIFGDK